MTRLLVFALLVAAAGCGSSDGDRSGSSPADSTDTGFLSDALSLVTSNPRLDSARAEPDCTTESDYSGRSVPFHTVPIDNGNDFNTTTEAFGTSSPDAQTPYVAYATWDPCALFLGMTGSAVGAGDCEGEDCRIEDRGESAYRYWMIYLDTDPQGTAGSVQPREVGPAPGRLPFRADYLVEVRLDGVTTQRGDGMTYQGNAQLYTRSSDWRVGLEETWQPLGREALTIGDNSSSNFIELAVSRPALGDPCAVRAIGWVVDTQARRTFAVWPPPRRGTLADSIRADSTAGTSADSLILDTYGFLLLPSQQPNASANLNRTDYSLVTDGCTEPQRPRE